MLGTVFSIDFHPKWFEEIVEVPLQGSYPLCNSQAQIKVDFCWMAHLYMISVEKTT